MLTHMHTHTQGHDSQRAALGAIIVAGVNPLQKVLQSPQKTPESTSKQGSHFLSDVRTQVQNGRHYTHQNRSQSNQRNIPGEGLCK